MKYTLQLFLCFIPYICFSQYYCKHKPKKFDVFSSEIRTEYAGLFLNGINLSSRQVQIEGNTIIGSYNNKYNQKVMSGFLQLRYALSALTEIQIGAWSLLPFAANTDTLYNNQIYIGVKQKIFTLSNRSIKWFLSASGKYIFQQSWKESVISKQGISLSLNNTWIFNNIFHLSLAGGSVYSILDGKNQPFTSGQILVKDEQSKIGIFIGFCVNHYIESFANLGLQITDNTNYILLLSIGAIDSGISTTFSYTQVFGRRR